MSNINKIVLAYSGGLGSSVILKWLITNYDCEVIAVIADIGQPENLEDLEKKALDTGAAKAYTLDLREDLARDYIFPMMRSAARYENRYLLGTAITRPCIANALVEIARAENADAIAHGSTGKGNDQLRFEFAIKALAPDLKIIAPWREWNLISRQSLIEFAEEHGIPLSDLARRYSMDANVLHTSFEGGELENPGNVAGELCHERVTPPEEAPDKPEIVEVGFVRGNPVSVNGEQLSPFEILAALGEMAGRNGIGRDDMVENRYVGIKCREIYENPAGTLLFAMHRDLEGICMDRELLKIRDMLSMPYSQSVYNGYWFSPERESMQAFFDKSQESVTGLVRAKLYKGGVWPIARTSPYSLFSDDLATFEGGNYNHKDAGGFIHLNSLRLGLYADIKRKQGHPFI